MTEFELALDTNTYVFMRDPLTDRMAFMVETYRTKHIWGSVIDAKVYRRHEIGAVDVPDVGSFVTLTEAIVAESLQVLNLMQQDNISWLQLNMTYDRIGELVALFDDKEKHPAGLSSRLIPSRRDMKAAGLVKGTTNGFVCGGGNRYFDRTQCYSDITSAMVFLDPDEPDEQPGVNDFRGICWHVLENAAAEEIRRELRQATYKISDASSDNRKFIHNMPARYGGTLKNYFAESIARILEVIIDPAKNPKLLKSGFERLEFPRKMNGSKVGRLDLSRILSFAEAPERKRNQHVVDAPSQHIW